MLEVPNEISSYPHQNNHLVHLVHIIVLLTLSAYAIKSNEDWGYVAMEGYPCTYWVQYVREEQLDLIDCFRQYSHM